MSIFSTILSVFRWLTKGFISHIKDADKVAVTVTEAVKVLLANPVTGFLANIADAITGTQIPSNIVTAINSGVIKVLAAELAIQGLPDNPNPAEMLAFENQVLSIFDVKANNSKLYTVLGAQVYGIIQSNIDNGKTNFADWVDAIEAAYVDYKSDLSANAVVNSGSPSNSVSAVPVQ